MIESKYGMRKVLQRIRSWIIIIFFQISTFYWKDDNDVEDSACNVESSNADQQGDRSCNDAEFKTTTTSTPTARATTTTTNGQVQIYILALLYLTWPRCFGGLKTIPILT